MVSNTARVFADDNKVYRNVLSGYGSDQLQICSVVKNMANVIQHRKVNVFHHGHNNRQTTYSMEYHPGV